MRSLSSFRVLERLEAPLNAASTLLSQDDLGFMGSSMDVSDALRRELEARNRERTPPPPRTATPASPGGETTHRSSSTESVISDEELREEATGWAQRQLEPYNDLLTDRTMTTARTQQTTGRTNRMETFRPPTSSSEHRLNTMVIAQATDGPGPMYTSEVPNVKEGLATNKFTGELGQPFDFDAHGSRIKRVLASPNVPPLALSEEGSRTSLYNQAGAGMEAEPQQAAGQSYQEAQQTFRSGSSLGTTASKQLSTQRSGLQSTQRSKATTGSDSVRFDLLDYRVRKLASAVIPHCPAIPNARLFRR